MDETSNFDSSKLEDDIKQRILGGNLRYTFKHLTNSDGHHYLHHDTILSQNISNNVLETTDYKDFPLKASYVTPLSGNVLKCDQDTSLVYIKEKNTWNQTIKNMKNSYLNIPRQRKINDFVCNDTSAKIPMYLLKFAELLNNDPDPYFDCYYNWYFCGRGNLSLLEINGNNHFIKSVNNTIFIDKIQHDLTLENIYNHEFKNESLIHETICSDNLNVGLRSKFSINLMKLSNQDNAKLCQYKTIKSKVPFTSINFNGNKLYYSCLNNNIYSYDIEHDNSMDLYINENDTNIINNHSSLWSMDNNILIQINNKLINIFDLRLNNKVNSIEPFSYMNCDKFTNLTLSNMNNSNIYVGSTHNLFLYDLRNSDNIFIKKWTHGLKNPPFYISTCMCNDAELIMLNNQLVNDSCLILNNDNKNILPWIPPTIRDTFKKVQLKGYCLDPSNGFKNRINMSLNGSVLYYLDDKLYSLTMNSAGDIFSQEFGNVLNKDLFFEDICDAFQLLSNKILNEKEFIASNTINMTKHYNSIKLKRKPTMKSLKNTTLLRKTAKWNKILKHMSECTDMCAHELLSVWELKPEDVGVSSNVPPPLDTSFNVKTWLDDIKIEDYE